MILCCRICSMKSGFLNIRISLSICEIVMEKQKILKTIQQSWIHSHEEDTETEMVFRPSDYDFPLSRGRAGFELKSDSKLVELNIAPSDGSEEETGSWDLEIDDDDLFLQLKPTSSDSRKFHIKSVNEDFLVVVKD